MAKKRLYDGKLLFETYCNWGAAASNPRLIEFARQTYGRASQMGPYYAMWKYAFKNPEEAFPLWKEYSFQRFPENPPPTWEEFVLLLRKKALSAVSIGGSKKDIKNFCSEYGIPMDFRINPRDVVQVVRPNHPLFQLLLIVDNVDDERVDAHYFVPDRGSYETANRDIVACQVNVNEIGVIGKVVV